VEEVVELMILTMVMFLAAFFCFKVLLFPETTISTIEKVHDIENKIHGK
tara:strand:- start:275 stop:421 length:147 start_codon:yes stop_codon:yes gene_type:complete